MKKPILILLLMMFAGTFAFADSVTIKNFEIKENPFAENEIAVVATDSLHHIQPDVNGIFSFTMNGFEEQLHFEKGTAFYRHKLDRSTFLYAKHINSSGVHSLLYYVYLHDSKIDTIHISWVVLVAIPLALILLGYMFKRFIIIAVVIFCIFLYFNHHNGLTIPTFFESVIDGLKGIF